jgi:phosphoribosylformimino-5-aminoimidazole carboxamide ribotide isomerase
MRILPVLDLLNGVVVRGVAGRRSEYRPVVSRLAASADPVAVAEAFRTHLGLSELYLADLDAIAGIPPALPTYRALRRLGFRLWVDAGVVGRERADILAAEDVGLVAGLETVASPDALADILRAHGGRTVFSLDLRGGVPIGDRTAWDGADAWEIAGRAVRLGARRLLVLDLARVGVGAGTGTETLCARLVSTYHELEVWAGGGVRNAEDLRRLGSAGARAALVASALHDGVVGRAECGVDNGGAGCYCRGS